MVEKSMLCVFYFLSHIGSFSNHDRGTIPCPQTTMQEVFVIFFPRNFTLDPLAAHSQSIIIIITMFNQRRYVQFLKTYLKHYTQVEKKSLHLEGKVIPATILPRIRLQIGSYPFHFMSAIPLVGQRTKQHWRSHSN